VPAARTEDVPVKAIKAAMVKMEVRIAFMGVLMLAVSLL
jgi:hypothetical protein